MGKGVSACATCDGFFFRNHDVAVVGGGDTAIEEATYLTRFARTVTIIHRRDRLRASKAMQEKAFAHAKIRFVWNSEIAEIMGDKEVTGIKVKSTLDGAMTDIPVTGVFIAIGHEPNTKVLRDQLACDEEGYIKTEAGSTRTSIPGVFAAGDAADRVYRQAITAAGNGCRAAIDLERYLELGIGREV
jgi:thioredoxin reductase (NADPH)